MTLDFVLSSHYNTAILFIKCVIRSTAGYVIGVTSNNMLSTLTLHNHILSIKVMIDGFWNYLNVNFLLVEQK